MGEKISKDSQIVTLKQIAQASGVSIGTVDRIIHNRGKVSKENEAKVREVIERLGYEPNVHASLLSVRKTITIGAILPYFQSGDFWSVIYNGIQQAAQQYRSLNLTIQYFYYNQTDPDTFAAACRDCEALKPNGIIIPPTFKAATYEFVQRMNSKGVTVVFVDTPIQGCDYLTYFGIDMFKSGEVAADLIFRGSGKIRKMVNFTLDRKGLPQNESFIKRKEGFLSYIREHKLHTELIDCTISPSDFLQTVGVVDKFFAEHPDVHHAITMSSRINLISDWMELRGRKDISLIGYDMTAANLKALRKGSIHTLIAERTDLESNLAAKSLIEYLALNVRPEKKDNYFPIDILTRYNVDYYL